MSFIEFLIPKSIIQVNTIFISILIEAIPFVLVGVFISGIIQIFITEEMISKWIPKNKYLSIVVGALFGAIYLACECGIVPIVKRLISKGVPLYAAIPFMITGPIINPIVLYATYIAFGESWKMVIERGGLAIFVAITMGIILSITFKEDAQLKLTEHTHEHAHHHDYSNTPLIRRIYLTLRHAVDEFFYMGKFLIIGGIIASCVQVFVPTKYLTAIGQGPVSSILVMMLLSYFLSLCSEADAFVASSFRFSFTIESLLAFLVFGAIIDIKNTLMIADTFKKKFVITYIFASALIVLLGSLLL